MATIGWLAHATITCLSRHYPFALRPALHFGIDLGTTNSLIAVFRDGKPELIPNALGSVMTPSVVALKDGALVVGEAARAITQADPTMGAALFKRAMGTERSYRIGRQDHDAPTLSAMVLSSLKADAEAHLGQPVTDVVISVPAYFNELQRKAVRAAGRIAGLNVLRLINEPTAAALAYGLHEAGQDQTIMVFDLGGGTFDVSILDLFDGVMEVRASAGDAFLGGEDFTDLLARYIAEQAALDPHDATLRPGFLKLAEQAKRGLTTAPEVRLDTILHGHNITCTITRDRFDDLTGPLMARLSAPIDRAMNDAGLRPEDISKVMLVGGATRMAAVRAYAAKKLKQFPTMTLDPDHVVALGAAVQAALVARDAALDDVVMTDVSAFTLGVETSRELGREWRTGYFAPIIERNSIVPISREQTFFTVMPGQEVVHFRIFQGEAPMVAGNLYLGEVSVRVPRNIEGREAVQVRFTYDVSGLLEVDVTVESTGRKANLVITKLAGELSDADIKSALKKLSTLKVHPRDGAENLHLRARLDAAYAMGRGEARENILNMISSLDQAIEAQDLAALATLRKSLHGILDIMEGQHVT
jgi:molecular chaperone HscC